MSDSYNLKGTVVEVMPAREGGGKTFQTIVVRTDGQYAQSVPVEFGGKSQEYAARLREGDPIDCDFSLRGREYNGKWYVNLSGFKINGGRSADKDFQRPDERPARDYKLDSPPRGANRDHARTQPPVIDEDEIPF